MRINRLILLSILALVGCDDEGDPADAPDGGGGGAGGGFPLAGTWVDTNNVTHTISETEWVQTFMGEASTFHVVTLDTDLRQIVAHNDAANPFNANLFSRFDWTVQGEDLYYCQSAFDAASAEAAADVPPADPEDLAMGCGEAGFPWSQLLPE